MLSIINNQRQETKTVMRYYNTATRMAKIQDRLFQVLSGMQDQNAHTPLVELRNDTAMLERYLAIPYEAKHILTICPQKPQSYKFAQGK